MMSRFAIAGLLAVPAMAFAQTPGGSPVAANPPAAEVLRPEHIEAPGGEVILADQYDRSAYDRFEFAPVRRSGDLLFLSGVIVARRAGEGTDVTSFKNEVRRAFRRIQ